MITLHERARKPYGCGENNEKSGFFRSRIR